VKEWSGNRSDSLIGQDQALWERYPFIRLCDNDGLCKGWSLGLCLCMEDIHRIHTEYSGITNHGEGQQTLCT
jgi:hypothetical protein